ncbi:uncharacterized protein [Typha angustifolia]|uniref:uncharacterized protein n=1 Tax=Typha angustifolia TaxID=59011 RepID=UPI003C2D9A23
MSSRETMLASNSHSSCELLSNTTLWFPGTKMEKFASTPPSARALEIAKRRQELLGLLNGLAESDFELSLTDLVENGLGANKSTEKTLDIEELKRTTTTSAVKVGRRKKRSNSGSSCGSSSDGVLLNFYMPTSLARSLTARSSSRALRNGRDTEPVTLGCWSALWERGRQKSRRSQAIARAR